VIAGASKIQFSCDGPETKVEHSRFTITEDRFNPHTYRTYPPPGKVTFPTRPYSPSGVKVYFCPFGKSMSVRNLTVAVGVEFGVMEQYELPDATWPASGKLTLAVPQCKTTLLDRPAIVSVSPL
jgi:hypothetical protein